MPKSADSEEKSET